MVNLTDRQKLIIKLLESGNTQTKVAKMLLVSRRTIYRDLMKLPKNYGINRLRATKYRMMSQLYFGRDFSKMNIQRDSKDE
jgi:DeoR/GlpR family transcriptional regulator of sugar metabolism